MRRHLVLALFGLVMILAPAPSVQAASPILRDDSTVTLIPDKKGRFSAIRVVEEIMLAPGNGQPVTISQRLQPWLIHDLIVVGADGLPLPYAYDRDNGVLNLVFPGTGNHRAMIRFSVDRVVQETSAGNQLGLDGLGQWSSPPATRKITVLFPQGFVPQHIVSSWDALAGARPVQRVALGVQALQVDLTKPTTIPLVLDFTPKLVTVATAWYVLMGALALLAALTAWRLGRLPRQGQREKRDPTPTELAYLVGGDVGAIFTAHLHLEMLHRVLRGGNDFGTINFSGVSEPYLHFILTYYQTPRSIHDFFAADCIHFEAAVHSIVDSLKDKGLLQDCEIRRQCGWDLLGYWATVTGIVGLALLSERPGGQAWILPWLYGVGTLLLAYLPLPVYYLRGSGLTARGRAQIAKYEALLESGLHNSDHPQGYMLQMTYGAAMYGVEWLTETLAEDHLALYRSVLGYDAAPADETAEEVAAVATV